MYSFTFAYRKRKLYPAITFSCTVRPSCRQKAINFHFSGITMSFNYSSCNAAAARFIVAEFTMLRDLNLRAQRRHKNIFGFSFARICRLPKNYVRKMNIDLKPVLPANRRLNTNKTVLKFNFSFNEIKPIFV